jgi:hypothetical protein
MNTIYYDHHINQNEWFIVAILIITITIIIFLPKRFPLSLSIMYFIVGTFMGVLFDHTSSIEPFDYYDVNDSSRYEFFDFMSYIMYGPFTYLIIYFYDKLNIKGYKNLLYILFLTGFGIMVEWICVKMGVFHYKNGYQILFSVPIYMVVNSVYLIYYHLIQK